MKNTYFILIPLIFILYGCPDSWTVPPGNPGSEKMDKKLLGTWELTVGDSPDAGFNSDSLGEIAFSSVRLSKIDNFSYKAEILKKSEIFTLSNTVFTGWVTKIDRYKIIYLLSPETGTYYSYVYQMNGKNSMELFTINLQEIEVDASESTENYRTAIQQSLQLGGCLRSEGRFVRK